MFSICHYETFVLKSNAIASAIIKNRRYGHNTNRRSLCSINVISHFNRTHRLPSPYGQKRGI